MAEGVVVVVAGVEPGGVVGGVEDDGHSVVDVCHECVGVDGEQGDGFDFATVGGLPMFENAGNS